MSFKITAVFLMSYFISSLLYPVSSKAVDIETTGIENLINIAGSQRMLSQRMMRDYCLVGLQVSYKNPAEDLGEIVHRFDRQLVLLQKTAANDSIAAAFTQVAFLWEPVKASVTTVPEKDKAMALHDDIELLLQASHKTVLLLEKTSGKESSKVVNVAGRQRMLSQRLAAIYMLDFWGLENGLLFSSFQEVVEEFREAHNYLSTSKETTPAIKKKLKSAAKTFRWFEKAAAKSSNRLTPEVIQRNSDSLLKVMNEITGMYASKEAN